MASCHLDFSASASFLKNKSFNFNFIAFPAHLEFGLLVGLDCFPHVGELPGHVTHADLDAFIVLLEIFADLGAMFSGEDEEGGTWTFGLPRKPLRDARCRLN